MRVVNLILAFVFAVSLSHGDPRNSPTYYNVPNNKEAAKVYQDLVAEGRIIPKPSFFKVCTIEVCRTVRTIKVHQNGRECSRSVTIVTYCDHYSNGTTRIWTRTF